MVAFSHQNLPGCSDVNVAGAGPGAAGAVQAGDQEAVRHRAQAAVPHRAPPAVQVRTFILNTYTTFAEGDFTLQHLKNQFPLSVAKY